MDLEQETESENSEKPAEAKQEVQVAPQTEVVSVSEPAAVAKPSATVAVDDTAASLALPELSAERAKLPWYAIHTYAGFESRAKLSLEERIRSAGLQEKFGHIIVPEETVVELQKGEKKTSTRKLFPSYMLVQLQLDDETWHLIKDTPKVTGFVGDARSPSPLSEDEVKSLIAQIQGVGQRPKPKVNFEQGDAVRVVDGPFADFNGTVDDVKPDKGKLRVLISIFGRNTPVELDFVQVEKV